mmetsp:Transcript_8930/g.26676  ORF Transcript_8930/g.26676 Transcript_8930/m.26676 type:complete len:203 (+) Transcript_8930:168-776(+)
MLRRVGALWLLDNPYKLWSASHSIMGLFIAPRPIMTPWRFDGNAPASGQPHARPTKRSSSPGKRGPGKPNNARAWPRSFTPPLRLKLKSGKCRQSPRTRSYHNGGTDLFCAGDKPESQALRACMMKCLQPPAATADTKSLANSGVSKSSTPKRHFTVTGICTARLIACTMSLTTSLRFISEHPNSPLETRQEGQPTLRFTSS